MGEPSEVKSNEGALQEETKALSDIRAKDAAFSVTEKWLGALLGFMIFALVGAILGGIAWYTGPRNCRR